MGLREQLIRLFRLPVIVAKVPSRRDEARAFLRSPESTSITLREFEKRFRITEVDNDSTIQGYPNASLYRPEVPEEMARNHKALEEYVKS